MHTLVFALLVAGPAETDTPEPAETVVAQADPAADSWSLALGLGFGQQYAGLGANLAGYARVAGAFSVGAFGSFGLVDLDTCCRDWGWTAGALATWGYRDRIALAVSYGAVWNERDHRDDTVIKGVTAAAGYELMTNAGFWLRWLIGLAFPTDELRIDDKDLIPSMNVGLGWKI